MRISYLIIILPLLVISCSKTTIEQQNRPAHHGDGRFINPYLDQTKEKTFGDVMKMRKDSARVSWEGMEDRVPVVKPDLNIIQSKDSIPAITWIGHSSFLIQVNGKNILTDPVFSELASPVSFAGPKRVHPPGISEKDLPEIDIVLISHNHYDHLDKDFVKSMKNRTFWVVPLGLKEFMTDCGVRSENIAELDWYGEYETDGMKIICTPAQHFSGRGLWDRFETLWCSYAVITDNFKFWFGGDTGYNEFQFKEIGSKYGPFDLSVIPIGAYKPRWFMKDMHTDPEEAVIVHKEIGSKFSIASHWGTFKLSSEGIDEPVIDLETSKAKHGIGGAEFIFMAIGETLKIK